MSLWKPRRSRIALCAVLFCCFNIYSLFLSGNDTDDDMHEEDISLYKLEPDSRRKGLTENCTLPHIDPWNADILQYTNLDYSEEHRWKNYMRTSLVNGTIRKTENSLFHWVWNCWGRCVYRVTDTVMRYSEWRPDTKVFDCDLVHVVCNSFTFYEWNPFKAYEAIHTQIKPVKRTHPPPSERKYSVYAIIIDSTAHTQAQVVFPKTLHFLKEQFSAVSFPYLNKVGRNSYPNGMPLFFGKSVEGYTDHPADVVFSRDMWYDEHRIVFDEFREMGYRTMYSEDWPYSFYNYPDWNGYNRSIVDHTMEPLRRMVHWKEDFLSALYHTRDFFAKDTVDLITYFDQYLKSYKGEPKFGAMWTISFSHDIRYMSIPLDTMFLKMLANNTEELDNSFVFFMGDHGLRFGPERFTETARLELNNPVLTVSLPRDLRNTKMQEMLQKNSKHLQTHFDTHATFLDIAKHQSLDKKIQNFEPFKGPNEKGESYLREQSKERNCKTLPIPPAYCICKKELEEIPTYSQRAIQMGKLVIATINNYHRIELDQAHLCPKWVFSRVITLTAHKPEAETGLYYITVAPSIPYDQAIFEAFITVNETGGMEVSGTDRRDKYGLHGECAKHSFSKPFCHCNPIGFVRRFLYAITSFLS